MFHIADLHAGEAKIDARDAVIITEAVRTLTHALRTLKLADEQIAELSMLCGFDDDLAVQTTQASVPPAPDTSCSGRIIGPCQDHPAVLDLFQ